MLPIETSNKPDYYRSAEGIVDLTLIRNSTLSFFTIIRLNVNAILLLFADLSHMLLAEGW
jgi:hypothetical protein